MDEIIAKILEIEKNSVEMVREAEDKQRDLEAIISMEQEKIHKAIVHDEKDKIAREKEEIITRAKDKAADYLNKSHQKIDAMDKIYKANRSHWVDQLFKKVLSQ